MTKKCIDGNYAAANIAYACSDMAAIYPITPSSTMAELCDEWQASGKKNVFDNTMKIVEMQSEAGAAGAVHGALAGGALTTTFTASQGLLLMIPNMYKIAGELLPCVFHVSARALATHALSIFGDHSDINACLSTGWAMMCSSNPQECQDLALVSHIASLNSSIPFIHFFDGFRTSHEIQKVDMIDYDDIKKVLPEEAINDFKQLALNPHSPHQRGTAQNPDVYFQNTEARNPFYECLFEEVENAMHQVADITGRKYEPFMYYGAKNAEKVIVIMGSGAETVKETVEKLNLNGENVGVIVVKLYRPFNVKAFIKCLPKTCKKIAVLDRVKSPASIGEPLYMDVLSATTTENLKISVLGGRYGLGGKEFTPACVKAVLDNLDAKKPINSFCVNINDDITHKSLKLDKNFNINSSAYEMKFFGLGSDGTISANKNSIKIIGDNTDKFVQGYFEYDSKKSGSLTISNLRVSDKPILSTYTCSHCDFVAIHNYSYINKFDMLSCLKNGGTVLLNTILDSNELSANLPKDFIETLKKKKAKLYTINALDITAKNNLGTKINMVMQSAFFKLTQLIPFETALDKMADMIKSTYAKKGDDVVASNINAITVAPEHIVEINVKKLVGKENIKKQFANDYVEKFITPILTQKGNEIPVSMFSHDGTVPTGTSQYEKRGIAENLPCWNSESCIQCGRCVAVCPHSALRAKLFDNLELQKAHADFSTAHAIGLNDKQYRVQCSPLDCTGCSLCANVCPAKNKAIKMCPAEEVLDKELKNKQYFDKLSSTNPYSTDTPKGLQFEKTYFEFSGACAGCGETPYIKMLTTLFGDKLIIANATGCSSIYGGSCPTCPYTKDSNGNGPAWANSLFEDNAEFGLGIKLARDIAGEKDNKVWIVGGDGWAYDIGYGGLDHILSSGQNVKILVLDTEVYSNTGGQSSKSTQLSAVAKFASDGKRLHKKDLAYIAASNQNCYVATISLGFDISGAIRAFKEADAFDGPAIIIAYAPCINHGINLSNAEEEMKKAVLSGYLTLFHFNPSKIENKLTIDSPEPTLQYNEFLLGENRFKSLEKIVGKDKAIDLFKQSYDDAMARRNQLKKLL